jgi:hypothetical protein
LGRQGALLTLEPRCWPPAAGVRMDFLVGTTRVPAGVQCHLCHFSESQITPGQSTILMTPGGKAGWSLGRAGPGLERAVRSVERGGQAPQPTEPGQHVTNKGPGAVSPWGWRQPVWVCTPRGNVRICSALQHRVSSVDGAPEEDTRCSLASEPRGLELLPYTGRDA